VSATSGSPRGTALVTGAARGIGAAVAVRLADDGFRVVCADVCSGTADLDRGVLGYPLRERADLDAVVDAVRAAGSDAVAVELDVRDADAVRAAVGGIDDLRVVVHAAGVVWGGRPLWSMPEEAWQAVLDVNVTGTYHVLAAAVPAVEGGPHAGRGRLVAVASAGATRGLPLMAAYAASKHAVVGLVRSLAGELGSGGTTVNAVAPGSTRTRILEASAAAYDLAEVEDFATHHTTGRLLEPAEIADAVSWLCSDGAGSVTGSVVAVDGGMTAV
jgi:SDR family mycofactocin-dependent oxidoreductase